VVSIRISLSSFCSLSECFWYVTIALLQGGKPRPGDVYRGETALFQVFIYVLSTFVAAFQCSLRAYSSQANIAFFYRSALNPVLNRWVLYKVINAGRWLQPARVAWVDLPVSFHLHHTPTQENLLLSRRGQQHAYCSLISLSNSFVSKPVNLEGPDSL
jgi:hypothetical protein